MVVNENTKTNSSRSLENYRKLAEGTTPGDGELPPGAGSAAPPSNVTMTAGPPPPQTTDAGATGGATDAPATTALATDAPPAGGSSPTTPAAGTATPSGPPTAGAHTVAVSSSMLLALGAFFVLL